MKIFISGASGLVGGNCLRYLTEQSAVVVGSHLSFPLPDTVYYNTLADDEANFDIVGFNPDVIIHCGALTHVDYCEAHQEESYLKTVESTQRLLDISKRVGAKFVLISTDYVFDGASGPYTESDSTRTLSVYGAHKLAAEDFVRKATDSHLILRITNVYGDEVRKKNFVARIQQMIADAAHISLRLPTDQYATPTNAYDVARALWLLLQDNKTGLYHIASTELMNRVTLAMRIISHFKYKDYEITPLSTAALSQPAMRPLLGGLIPKRFLEEYPTFLPSTLDEYLSQKNDRS